ncbi:MAG TPA: ribose-phosphate pyrophosphokinase [Candidatus Binatia bacterium]
MANGVHPVILSGSANHALASSTSVVLGCDLGRCTCRRFPDGELHVVIEESIRGRPVFLIQPTSPPVDAHLMELLFLADACRRAGAERITAVIPYFGYARQDRRSTGREPIGARLISDLIQTAGVERVIAVDLHSTALEGAFPIPLEHLSAVPALARAVGPRVTARAVVVSPDLGAIKLAERYGRILDLPVALVHKVRMGPDAVTVKGIIGDVKGHPVILVDDMISTGATIEAAAGAVLAAGCLPDITVIATHGLFVGSSVGRLHDIPISRVLITDSVVQTTEWSVPVEVVGLAPLLAEAIRRLEEGRSMSDLIVHDGN